jgi:hypothetical protein
LAASNRHSYNSFSRSFGNSFSLENKINEYDFKLILDNACGLLGFVKFLKGYYLLMITKK